MSKKLNILKYAKFQALICAMVGLLFGIFYSFGGLIVDTLVTLELLIMKRNIKLHFL